MTTTDQQDRDWIIDKIEKVLRRCKPEANATEAEVEQAMAFAEALMRKHNIELAEVLESRGETLEMDSIVEEDVHVQAKADKPILAILNAVTIVTGTKAYKTTRWVGNSRKIVLVIYGYKDDVAVARRMFSELITISKTFAKFKIPGRWSRPHYWYQVGFANGLYSKALDIQAQRMKADQEATGNGDGKCTALIVRKGDLIRQYEEQTLNLRPARVSRRREPSYYNTNAFQQGVRDGREYEYGEKLENGKKTPRLPN